MRLNPLVTSDIANFYEVNRLAKSFRGQKNLGAKITPEAKMQHLKKGLKWLARFLCISLASRLPEFQATILGSRGRREPGPEL